MARIAGVDIPDNKRGEIRPHLHFWHWSQISAQNILSTAGVSMVNKKVKGME